MASRQQLAVQAITAWTRFVAKQQHGTAELVIQPIQPSLQRLRLVGDLAPINRLIATRHGDRHGNRLLVHIQPNKAAIAAPAPGTIQRRCLLLTDRFCDILFHDLPPQCGSV